MGSNLLKLDGGRFSAYEDIFANGRQGETEIRKVPLDKLHEFPGHPFSVKEDEDMKKLQASIEKIGLQQPITLRPREDGEYDIISGHRRAMASRLAGLEEIDAVVKEMDDYEAVSWMVDSNLNTREVIAQSEKAKAIKMEYDAFVKYNKGRISGRTDEAFAETKKMSRMQVHRYLKLNDLVPDFLALLDDGKVPFVAALKLADLPEEEQQDVYRLSVFGKIKITPAKAERILEHQKKGSLSDDVILDILLEKKPKKKEQLVNPAAVRQYMPRFLPEDKYDDYIVKALKYYAKHQEKKNEVTI